MNLCLQWWNAYSSRIAVDSGRDWTFWISLHWSLSKSVVSLPSIHRASNPNRAAGFTKMSMSVLDRWGNITFTSHRWTPTNAYDVLQPTWNLCLTVSVDFRSSVPVNVDIFSFVKNSILALLNYTGIFGIFLDALSVMHITFAFYALNMFLILYVLSSTRSIWV